MHQGQAIARTENPEASDFTPDNQASVSSDDSAHGTHDGAENAPFFDEDGESGDSLCSASEIRASRSPVHRRRTISVLFSLGGLVSRDSKKGKNSKVESPHLKTPGGDHAVSADSASSSSPTLSNPFQDDDEAVEQSPYGIGREAGIPVPVVKQRSTLGPWLVLAALILAGGAGFVAWTELQTQRAPSEKSPTTSTAKQSAAQAMVAMKQGEAQAASEKSAADKAPSTQNPAASTLKTKPELAAAASNLEAPAGGNAADSDPEPGLTGSGKEAVKDEGSKKDEKGQIAAANGESSKAKRRSRSSKKRRGKKGKSSSKSNGAKAASSKGNGQTKAADKDTKSAEVSSVAQVAEAKSSAVEAKKEARKEDVNALLNALNKKKATKKATQAAPDANLPSRLSTGVLRATLRKGRKRFAKCYKKMGAAAQGPVTLKTSLMIASGGTVKSASITNAGGATAEVQACVVGVLKGIVFPRFAQEQMTVNYPIVLR